MPTTPGTRIVTKIVFPVSDMQRATSFYGSLGFEVESFDADYAWVTHRGEEILHLALVPNLDPGANHAAGYFHVQDATEWHAAWTAGGADVGPIDDHPWGMREFALKDPSGNRLRIGQNL